MEYNLVRTSSRKGPLTMKRTILTFGGHDVHRDFPAGLLIALISAAILRNSNV